MDKLKCCYLDPETSEPVEDHSTDLVIYEVIDKEANRKDYMDYTHACTKHVGAMIDPSPIIKDGKTIARIHEVYVAQNAEGVYVL